MTDDLEVRRVPAMQLVIVYVPSTDQCSVQGPLQKTGLCYAALERAKEEIHKMHNHKQSSLAIASRLPDNGSGGA